MDKIKLAVLGLNQGSKIARDAKANPEIELVAVAGFGDHDVKVAEELGVPLYNDYTLLLKQEDLDAVAIALPKPTKVYAAARNTIRGNEVEDSVSAVVEYEGGVTASYFVSDGTPGPWNYDLAAEENTFFTMCPGENSMRVFGTKGSFGFPNMDLYYQDDDAYGWLQPIKHEHFDVEKNDPMTAELEHFVDLCLGRETTPRCTGDNALDTLKVINAIQKSAEDETPVKL